MGIPSTGIVKQYLYQLKNMKTKAIYILVSNGNDYYLEQLYLSLFSLKHFNPKIEVEIVSDDTTYNSLKTRIYNYVKDVKIIIYPVSNNMSNFQKSRILKTNLRQIVKGDYLFIDTDTIICDDLSSIDDSKHPLMAVKDLHIPIRKHPHKPSIISQLKNIRAEIFEEEPYFNSGILYVKDIITNYDFYSLWNKEWEISSSLGCNYDQPALYKANIQFNKYIKELDGIWNCQIVENGLKYLHNSKILHYFASKEFSSNYLNPFIFNNKTIYAEIRENEGMTCKIEKLIACPKSAFIDRIQLISDNEIELINSPYYRFLKRIFFKHRPLLEKIHKLITKIKQ